MFCRNCGKSIKDTSQFCPYCGTKVAEAPPAPAAGPTGGFEAQQSVAGTAAYQPSSSANDVTGQKHEEASDSVAQDGYDQIMDYDDIEATRILSESEKPGSRSPKNHGRALKNTMESGGPHYSKSTVTQTVYVSTDTAYASGGHANSGAENQKAGGYSPAGYSSYINGGAYGAPGSNGNAGGYGAPGSNGNAGIYGAPGSSGNAGVYGAPGSNGNAGGYGAAGGNGNAGGYGAPGGNGNAGGYGAAGGPVYGGGANGYPNYGYNGQNGYTQGTYNNGYNKTQAPGMNMGPQAAPEASNVRVAKPKKKLGKGAIIGICAGAAVVVIAIIVVVCLLIFGGGSYEKPLKDLVSAMNKKDVAGLVDTLPLKPIIEDSDLYSVINYDGIIEMYETQYQEYYLSSIEDEFGSNYKVSYELYEATELTEDALESLNSDYAYSYGTDDDFIDDAMQLDVDMIIESDEGGSSVESTYINVVKIDGKWYIDLLSMN